VEPGHRTATQLQYEHLLRQARHDNVYVFYCFNNGWSGPWLDHVANFACPDRAVPSRRAGPRTCAYARLEDYGCAVAPAWAVARRHKGEPRRGRLALEEYLRISRPWSHLVADRRQRSPGLEPIQLIGGLPHLIDTWAVAAEAQYSPDTPGTDLPSGIAQGRHQRLPPWLEARREGRVNVEGYRPAVAVVLDVG
jgi:hypothetical protein